MFLGYMLLENTENNMSKKNLPLSTQQKVKKSLNSRYKKETLFQYFGLSALSVGIIFLVIFFFSVLSQGVSAFSQTYISLEVDFSDNLVLKNNKIDSIDSNFDAIIRSALRERFPEVKNRRDRRELYKLVSIGAVYQLIDHLDTSPGDVGSIKILSFPTSSDVDMYVKGNIDRKLDESKRAISNKQMLWIDELLEKDEIKLKFNSALFSNGDSREPELAGIFSALKGSFFMLLITLIVSFPVGIAAAIYLEEFAPKNKISDLIEVNINNLAAVPSIVFWSSGFSSFYKLVRSSKIIPTCRRVSIITFDLASNYHFFQGRYNCHSSFYKRGCSGRWCFSYASCRPPHSSASFSRHVDRCNNWHEPSFRRICTSSYDRYGGIYS